MSTDCALTQFCERLHVEPKVGLRVIALGSRDVGAMRQRVAGQQTDAGIVPALGKVVADFQLIFTTAQLACVLGRKIIGKREEDFRAERGSASVTRSGN